MHTHVAIVGAGIVGLATAFRLSQRFPGLRVVVLEKEHDVALHQTGRNSGVLHSGIYYAPGSLKARNCVAGKAAMEAFCDEEGIPYERCGKVIVAVEEAEVPMLEAIYRRGQQNGVRCTRIGADALREIEPHAAGIQALHVPDAGIVDYRTVSRHLARRVEAAGGEVRTNAEVLRLEAETDGVTLRTRAGILRAALVVNCGGLYSDRVVARAGDRPDVQIVPFRGEYYDLAPEARHLCRGLIYPVPDPSFPFLGVHFTRMIGGGVECGPNAVLALAREGYTRGAIDAAELLETLRYAGFRRLAARHWRTGLGEFWRSFSKRAFVRALQRLVPAIEGRHLSAAPAGVRAQAVAPDGRIVDDFIVQERGRVVHVCNAPSPAATASLQIGTTIVDRLAPLIGS